MGPGTSSGAGSSPFSRPRDRNAWYVVAIVVLAPLLAETVASSNTPAVIFPLVLPLYVVVYGCPALLLRELRVRGRMTVPRFIAFGIAYTAFNEGVVAATWFKLSPGTDRVLAFTAAQAGHAAGVNWAVAVNLVVFHTVYSLMIPVTLVQALAVVQGSGADARPWIGRRGVATCVVFIGFIIGGSLTPRATAQVCSGSAAGSCPPRRAGAAALVVMVGLVLLYLAVTARGDPRPREGIGPARATPTGPSAEGAPGDARPARLLATRWSVAVGALYGLAFFGSFFGLPSLGQPALAAVTGLVLLGVAGWVGIGWCRRSHRVHRQEVALALGAMLPGMAGGLTKWATGQPVPVLIAAVFIGYLLRRLPPSHGRPASLG